MLITTDLLKERAQNTVLNENLISRKLCFDAKVNYDLFISHSYSDRKIIMALHDLFEDCGYHVYVDWIEDRQLDREKVTSDTAQLLKSRISQCKGLAFVASSNTSKSKWCPWELGLADGMLNGKACILPIFEEDSKIFKGTEYLGLYSYVDYAMTKTENKQEFWVTDASDNQKYIVLREWLNGKKPYYHK